MSSAPTSAQERFRTLVSSVAPGLRATGLRRAGSIFFLSADTHWALLEFQRHRLPIPHTVRFTVNLGVASKALLAFLDPDRPPDRRPRIDECCWRQRIGFLLPAGSDTWWEIDEGTDVAVLAGFLEEHLVGEVVPLLYDLMDDRRLVSLWLTGRSPGLTEFERLVYLSILAALFGDGVVLSEAKQQLARLAQVQPATSGSIQAHLERLDAIA